MSIQKGGDPVHCASETRFFTRLTVLAARLACCGALGAAATPLWAKATPTTEELLQRMEQMRADSDRQIEALRQQILAMSVQRVVDTAPIAAGASAQTATMGGSQVNPNSPAGQPVFAGSSPGFIQVPGSANEFKISGRLFVTGVHDFTGWTNGNSATPTPAPGNFAPNRIPVQGFSNAYSGASGVPGGTALQAWGSGIYAEIRRPTSYGPLSAFVGLDAVPPAQVPVNQSTSNNVTARLQRAYLSLGRLTVGQDFPNFTPSFRADTADPGPVPGIDWMLRSPQIRYAWDFGPQTQLRLALENPDTDVACFSGGTAGRYACGTLPTTTTPATVGNTSRGTNGIGFPTRPVLSAKLEHRFPQGRGLVSVHAMAHQLKVDDGAGHAASAGATAFGIAGWLQTRGLDRVYGHVFTGKGLGHFSGDYYGWSGVYDGGTRLEVPRQTSMMLGYRLHLAPAHRISATYGFSRMDANSILPLFTENYVRKLEFAALNYNWEVVENVNYFLEFDWGRRTMQQGASGTARRMATGLRYFF